jgi:hypothetical protein
VAGGAVSATENNGNTRRTGDVIPADPDAYQGVCFLDVPEGNYNITVGIPDNYNPTVELNRSLDVNAGDLAFVGFGVQSKDIVVDPVDPTNTGTSPIFGVLGGLLLLGGAALGYYAWNRKCLREQVICGSGLLKNKITSYSVRRLGSILVLNKSSGCFVECICYFFIRNVFRWTGENPKFMIALR